MTHSDDSSLITYPGDSSLMTHHLMIREKAKRGKTDGWNDVDHNNFVRMWDKNCDQAGDIWDEEKFVMLLEVWVQSG